ncbi:hypothetical protein ACVWY3_005243 [Bradyrhizobium sp. USDA 4486]
MFLMAYSPAKRGSGHQLSGDAPLKHDPEKCEAVFRIDHA